MAATSFDITELAHLAGVTGRTVRYYVQQGLLPAPPSRGPGARYEQGHLDRLRLIRRLQSEHLPLAEIRRRLESLGDEDVRRALLLPPPAPVDSALHYVRSVLASTSPRTSASLLTARAAPPVPVDRAAPSPAAAMRIGDATMSHAALQAAHPAPSTPQAAASGETGFGQRSTWERIDLAPDIELHVRRPLTRAQNRWLEALLRAARTLSTEEP
jgi:DNA-binding transcriptional MerR regulator